MMTTFRIVIKNSVRDIYLLFWSILLPMGLLIGLGLYFDEQEYHIRLLSGVIGTSAIFWAMETTVFYILQQRNKGFYKLLKITPMKISHFIIAMTLAWTVILLIVVTFILIIGILFLHIQIQLSGLMAIYGILIIGTLCFTFISFLVANISKNEGQASTFANILAMPMLFLSSAFYNFEHAPFWVRAFTLVNPFSYFVNGLNNAISSNFGSSIINNIIILIGFSVIALIASVVTFRWDAE